MNTVKAPLTDLRQETAKVTRLLDKGMVVTITNHGVDKYVMKSVSRRNKAAAAAALLAIGPVKFLPRK